HALAALGRPAIARHIDRDAAEPGGHMRELEDPARLVHRIGMRERHHRSGSSHPLVIQRSVDVLSHFPYSPWRTSFSAKSSRENPSGQLRSYPCEKRYASPPGENATECVTRTP